MIVLADILGGAIGIVVLGVVAVWFMTLLDILRIRPGLGFTIGVILFPLFAVPLWWLGGRKDAIDPSRAKIARTDAQRQSPEARSR